MAKIKVFKFEVSNFIYGTTKEEYLKDSFNTEEYYNEYFNKLATPEQIEDTVNSFLEDKELINLNVNTVDIHYPNNGYENTVELVYTITYNEKLKI